jgi:deoxycytidylate deaminase
MTRTQEKFMRVFRFANDLALLSTCKGLKCGAVAFAPDFSAVHAIGYNGPPHGSANDSCTAPALQETELARCGCIHAEANLVAKLGHLPRPAVVYSTTMPCPHCAGLLVNCRQVKAVIWERPYWTTAGADTLVRAGIDVAEVSRVVRSDDRFLELCKE